MAVKVILFQGSASSVQRPLRARVSGARARNPVLFQRKPQGRARRARSGSAGSRLPARDAVETAMLRL